jgi:hypothetical protein
VLAGYSSQTPAFNAIQVVAAVTQQLEHDPPQSRSLTGELG